jgi:hypothetical protein
LYNIHHMTVTQHEPGALEHCHAAADQEEPVVPLRRILDFIMRQDAGIQDQVSALTQESPTRFSPPAEMVKHAGYIGVAAGRRLMLEAIASEIVAATTAEAAQAESPHIPTQAGPSE